MHKIGSAHLECLKKHYAKFEYKGMKRLKLQITISRHSKSVADGWKMDRLDTYFISRPKCISYCVISQTNISS